MVGSLSAQAPAANEGTSGALKPAPLFSRGAATECSPGRKPGVGVVSERSPGGAKDSERLFRPSGAEIVSKENPGLAPGATLCRRSAAVHGGLFRVALENFRKVERHDDIAISCRDHDFLMCGIDPHSVHIQSGQLGHRNFPAWSDVSVVVDVPDTDGTSLGST